LGFIDGETRALAWFQAGCRSHDAVDIRHQSATPARDVVVVVAYPGFVPRWSRAKINLAQQASFGEGRKSLVYRLEGDMTDALPDHPGDFVGARMLALAHGVQDGQPRGCYAHPRGTQPVGFVHDHHLTRKDE
jgi:hypothetical protein